MRKIVLSLALACSSVPAYAGSPSEIVVRVVGGKCTAYLAQPRTDLTALIPEAKITYVHTPKDAPENGVSCNVSTPKDKFLAKFEFCALASSIGSECGVDYDFGGGRFVDFQVLSTRDTATCTFACIVR